MTGAGSQDRRVFVAVDAMGGDAAPRAVLDGVASALVADPDLHVLLVGTDDVVGPFAESHARCEAVHADSVIGMGEHAAQAVRGKPDSSIVAGCRLVKEGRAAAFFSAGNTGAVMAAATLVLGRIPGVSRPAIATVFPAASAPCVLLDVGANADCKPEHLLQFAHMGIAYARAALGVEHPRAGLLNIGEEETKGSMLAQDAHALMANGLSGFVGNIEGRDLPRGMADVVVTDGFTGNVCLKLMEGLSETLLGEVRAAISARPIDRLAALVLRPSLASLKRRLDPDTYGGAPLLGVRGVCVIGHGGSTADAVAAALRVCATSVRGGLTDLISGALATGDPDSLPRPTGTV